jgi:hypothetical protein
VVARSSGNLAALLGIGAALLLGSGCGSTSPAAEADLRLQREDLIATARGLAALTAPTASEVRAARAAWPQIANGLPANVGATQQTAIDTAVRSAAAVRLPVLFGERRAAGLTGPAAGLAGTMREFAGLSANGWRMVRYAVQAEAKGGSAASFARANSPLYIESVYDAHFGLSQLGKKLLAGYAKLGGPGAFGRALTQSEVQRLAGAYSEPAVRLHPHAGVKLGS